MGIFIRMLLIGALLPVAACTVPKNEDKPKTPDAVETIVSGQQKEEATGILSPNNVKVTFEENVYPGVYTMKISWPPGIHKVQIALDDQAPRDVLQKNQYEEVVAHNSDLTIQLQSFDKLGLISSLEIKAKSPRDFIIEGEWNLRQPTKFDANRLFLLKGAQIRTNGFSLNISVSKIIIDSERQDVAWWRAAHILTAIPDSTASTLHEIFGSNISIKAQEAHGHLKVALIGVNGRNGRDGAQILSERGLDTEKKDPALTCETGSLGIPGEDGWPGGMIGSLIIEVENYTDFSVSVGKRRGKPGAGGIGSVGFPGEAGGQPKSGSSPCGTTGADGKPGTETTGEFIYLGPFKSEIHEL